MANNLYVGDKEYSFQKYATKSGQERVAVRDNKGHFVTHFKYVNEDHAKFGSMQRLTQKYHIPARDVKEEKPRFTGGHPGPEKEGGKPDEYVWKIKFTKDYDSKQSNTEIYYEAEGYFEKKPDSAQRTIWIQNSFVGAWFSTKTKHGIPAKLFHELVDRSDIVNGVEERQVKLIKSGDASVATTESVHEREVRNKIHGTIIFKKKNGKEYKYENW